MTKEQCLEGFPRHRWQSTGLDIDDAGNLIRTRRCPSCGTRQVASYNSNRDRSNWRKDRRPEPPDLLAHLRPATVP